MRRIITIFTVLLTLLSCRTVLAEGTPMAFEESGISIDFEDVLNDSEYLVDLSEAGIISHSPFVSFLYLSGYTLPKEILYKLNEQYQNADEETKAGISNIMAETYVDVALVIVTDEENPDAAVDMVFNTTPEGLEVTEIGEAEGYHYYEVLLPVRETTVNSDVSAEVGIDAEELRTKAEAGNAYMEQLRNVFDERLKTAKLQAPEDPAAELIGQTMSFETTDIDGNPVTSDELFRDNKFTMVNVWGTWCINCVGEMQELTELHTMLKEQGCGIVGIEWESQPIETMVDEIHAFMEEKGINYPNVVMPEGNVILDQVTAFPTTYFVDGTGKILTHFVVGANVEEYKRTIEMLLADEEKAAETNSGSGAELINSGSYRVVVCDKDGSPVEGVLIQFCDDATCQFQPTDESGTAVFEAGEQKVYEVHVLQVPEGFAPDEKVYAAEDASSDVNIVLEKAA